MGDGNRWLEVAPTGSSASVALMPPREGAPHNDQAFLVFGTKDLDADHAALKERGVDVDDEPMGGEGDVPRMFFFRDPDGNNLLEVEESEA